MAGSNRISNWLSGPASSQAAEASSRSALCPASGLVTGVLSVTAVAALRWLLGPVLQEGIPYTMFLAAVALSTRQGGRRCGLAVTGLALVLGTLMFVPPHLDHYVRARTLVTQLVFMASSLLVIWLLERERKATLELQAREKLLRNAYAERARLERELEQAQRLESVGRLAAGVAHDFNNLLTVILGGADLLRRQLPDNKMLESILLAATRAGEITKQLLGLGRRQMMDLRPMTMNEALEESMQLCESLMPENIAVSAELEEQPWQFDGDASLMQQVVLNLLANARDAMPSGGKIRLEANHVRLDESFALHHPDVTPGEYVHLGVMDTGSGIDAQTREHIFEPFFTNKKHGTGLGLAVVYGLVKQLRGYVYVESQVGLGTRFDIYLPRSRESAGSVEGEAAPSPSSLGRRLRVMLVEDNPLVRAVLERMLQSLGHIAVVAEDGAAALALLGHGGVPIDAVVTDIVMPGIDGYELADRLRLNRPDLGVVLISGYSDKLSLQGAAVRSTLVFLGKPFSAPQLAGALASACRVAPAEAVAQPYYTN